VGAVQLKPNSVTSAAIVNGSIGTAKIADASVTAAKVDSFGVAGGFASLDSNGRIPENHIPDRLSEAGIQQTVADAMPTSYESLYNKFVCWGDSMTAASYPTSLASLAQDIEVINAGIGGERSYDIAARQGGNPLEVLVDGGMIPASGSVFLTPQAPWTTMTLMKQSTKTMNPATLYGVEGTFVWSSANGRYVFTRLTAGTAVTLPPYPIPVISNSREAYKNHTAIFWLGRNNASQTDRIMNDIQSSINGLGPAKPRWLVLGVINSTTEIAGTATHTAILELTRQQQSRYGRRFVDVRRWLIDYGLQTAGITPTANDLTHIANDTVPESLRSDSVHLNSIGNQLVARCVMNRLVEFGWATWKAGPTPPLTVDETILYSDSFDSRANGSVLNNTQTDQALGGGTSATWTTITSSAFTVTNGVIARGASTNAAVAGVSMSTSDYRVDVTVTAFSTLGIGVRRTTISAGSDHRININIDGTAKLLVSNSTAFNYVPGDRIGIRVIGTTLQALINDVVVDEVHNTASLTEAGFACVLATANSTYSFTDFAVRVPVTAA
jgi:hypothetical protein